MKKGMRWLLLLTKRLYKTPMFLLLLALLVVITLLYSTAARQDSGMVTIALAAEDPGEPLASHVTKMLTSEGSLLHFIPCGTVEEAQKLVTTGKADGAWLFPADMTQKLSAFLVDFETPIVTVVQRQENTALRLAREVLNGAIYRCCAQPVYLNYIREYAPGLDAVSEEQLLGYFNQINGNENLFQFTTAGGSVSAEPTGYLLSPLRGLLGVLMIVCGLAAALSFGQDLRSGTFGRVPLGLLPLVELGCQAAALVSLGAASLISLAVCGLTVGIGRELAVTVLYCLCVGIFSMLLRRLLGERLLAGALPVLSVAMIAVCPVFFDISALGWVRYLLPPTYYIQAVYSDRALLGVVGYILACLLACLPLILTANEKS